MSRAIITARRKSAPRPTCRSHDADELATYSDIVSDYIRKYRENAASLLRFFRDSTVEQAVEYAARCKLPTGKRHPHQYRISKFALLETERRLWACAAELSECQSFAELHEMIRDRIGVISGIGALTIYDVANHLGAYLGLEPKVVYLHAGTAEGAKALGCDHTAESLDPAALPTEFGLLRPHEIEDCLCLYKRHLEAIGRRVGQCT